MGVIVRPRVGSLNPQGRAQEEAMSASTTEKEITKLTLQIEEYYDSIRKWAQVWMTLFVLSICFELLLVLFIVISFFISYQRELLAPDSLLGNLVTWWNVRILVGAIFFAYLLIIFAANFNKRWRLNQATMAKLADLRVDLTDLSGQPGAIRTNLKSIIGAHNQGLKKQKMFKGPELQ